MSETCFFEYAWWSYGLCILVYRKRCKIFGGERSTSSPAESRQQRINTVNMCHPPTYRGERPGRCFPDGQSPPGLGNPAHASTPAPPAYPSRVALTTQPPRERPPRPSHRAAGPPTSRLTCRVRGSAPPPTPRPRGSAAGQGAGRPLSAPRQRSPRRPTAALSGRKRLRSNRFQLLQTKPPGHSAGRGRRSGGAGTDVTPGAVGPMGGRVRGAVPRVPGKGLRPRPRAAGPPRDTRRWVFLLAGSRRRDLTWVHRCLPWSPKPS